jgi:hypothetical protein
VSHDRLQVGTVSPDPEVDRLEGLLAS